MKKINGKNTIKPILSKLTSRKAHITYFLTLVCIFIIIQTSGWQNEKLIVFRWSKGKGLQISIEKNKKMWDHFEGYCYKKEMLVIISSSPENYVRRDIIRKTWGSSTFFYPRSIKIYFLMGAKEGIEQNKSNNESLIYKDLIIFNYNDFEMRNVNDSVNLLNYLSTNFSKSYEYLVITSDYVYLNLPKLYDYLPNCYNGLMLGNLDVLRTPQYYEICIDLNCQIINYTEHLVGSTYVVSSDVITKLYNITNGGRTYSKTKLRNNDFITGVLAAAINVTLFNHQMFTYIGNVVEPCILEYIVVSHQMTRAELIEAHTNLINLKSQQNYQELCEGTIVVKANMAPQFQKTKLQGPDNPYGPSMVIQNSI